MARNKKLKENILGLTEGVLETTVDFVIFLSLWGLDIFSTPFQSSYNLAPGDAVWLQDAMELINYQRIKKAISNARSGGWIAPAGGGRKANPQITAAGKKRLEARLPFYDEERVWDKVLHLVTYDISEEQRNDREILREKLQKIGCGMLQKSVWITPYNPRDTLREFIQERKLRGAIVISSLGKDSSIGEESVEDLVYKVYKLENLNERYSKFLQEYGEEDGQVLGGVFAYLSILQEDPQLPFELLPEGWRGDEAYGVYMSYIAKLRKSKKNK